MSFSDPERETLEFSAPHPSPDGTRLGWQITTADGEAVARLELVGRFRREWLPADISLADEVAACIAHELDLQRLLAKSHCPGDALPVHHVTRDPLDSHAPAQADDDRSTRPAAHDGDVDQSTDARDLQERAARVLLADDLDLNRKLICDMLALEGHHVDGVADGREAVEAASRGGYDLILMDIIMPGMDGLAATREIRSLPAPMCDVPIVALTANSFREQLDSCLEAGMNGTLSKPLSLDTLTTAVAEWTRGRLAA